MSGTPLSDTIVLGNQEPLAGGLTQFVYQHPHDAGLLIKVRRVDKLQRSYDLTIGADSDTGVVTGFTQRGCES